MWTWFSIYSLFNMRFKLRRYLTPIIVVLNFILFFYAWKPFSNFYDYVFIIREFESFENDLYATRNSISSLHPNNLLFIITDEAIYPPINPQNGRNNSFIINRAPAFSKKFAAKEPLLQIEAEFIFIVPDSTILPNDRVLRGMIKYLHQNKVDFIALKHKSNENEECLNVKVNAREWSIEFSPSKHEQVCSIVKGKHLLLARTEVLMKLSDPFMQPFPESLYLQMSALNMKVFVDTQHQVDDGRPLFTSQHNQWKKDQLLLKQRLKFYKTMGIKKIVDDKGNIEWFGCRKDTPRCFGTVIDDMPSYLYAGKWTPPCCLDALRKTARHVFRELEKSKIRYWLEGGSLLGAFRSGDIIPWDYDIDVGIYLDDLNLNRWLKGATIEPTVDDKGFLWEKAIEGDFFRVQYSPINHLHVDIFPFYPKNGTMTKNTWFKNHAQDREFPEAFLKPLSTIFFVGRKVSAPNNIREFLTLKFGADAIQKPAYPNPSKLAFPHTYRAN